MMLTATLSVSALLSIFHIYHNQKIWFDLAGLEAVEDLERWC